MRILFSLLSLAFVAASCNNKKTPEVKRAEISFTKDGELQLIKSSNDSIVAVIDIEIADNEYKTQTGLMYRQSMADSQGMLFVFPDEQPRSFYMKNTEIALDIIYISSGKEIVSFQKNARPFDDSSLPSGKPAMYVLEVNAGLSDRWNLEIGDKIEYQTQK